MDSKTAFEQIRLFHSLAAALDKLPAPPPDPSAWLKGQTGPTDQSGLRLGLGRRYAAQFLLHLWGKEPLFDLRRAWAVWDVDHRTSVLRVLQGNLTPELDAHYPDGEFAAGNLTVP